MLKRRPTIRDHSAEANLFARRAFVGFIFILALVAILLSNLYTIQVDDHQVATFPCFSLAGEYPVLYRLLLV